MNWAALQAFVLQLSRVGVGCAGIWVLIQPNGNQAVGWTLLGISGLTVGVDVAKVNDQIKKTAIAATQAASTTTIIQKQEPVPPAVPQPGASQ